MTDLEHPALNILLVDDDEGDAFIMEDLLEDLDLNLTMNHVLDGYQALAYLKRQSPYEQANLPDLILLDLNMPRMGGKEFLDAIRQDPQLAMMPVLILTTSSAESDVKDGYSKGGNCYLVKPVGIEPMIKLLRSMNEFWGTVAELPSKYLH